MGERTETGPVRAESGTLWTRPLALLLFTAFFTAFAFYLLLSVVPLYAAEVGTGSSGAGFATAALMLSGVLIQLRMPKTVNRVGYRAVLATGLVLLGPPSLLYLIAEETLPILVTTVMRGAGFGATIVVFAALVVELVPRERRGEGLGLYGVAFTVPAIFGNPLGLWLAEHFGYAPVFLLGSAFPLLGLLAALAIPYNLSRRRVGDDGVGFFAGLRRGALLRLVLLFAFSTAVVGTVVTFLPLTAPDRSPFSAATALLLFWVVGTLSRWCAGRFGDRYGPRLLLEPGLVIAILGMITLSLSQEGMLLLCGALSFGAGFGILQSSTLIMTMERVSDTERGLGSALWNVAFDAGMGIGALLFGFAVGAIGFTGALYLCTVLLTAAFIFIPPER